ncbi:MAG TPA: hypothetical protein VGB49_07920 [Caulobacteraceae bacterium]
MKRPLIALAAALTLSACATATTYAPEGFGGQRGGYAEQRLEQNRFRVSFSGNSLTSRDTVEMYLLHRAAELTVETGHDWFEIADRATERDTRYVTTGISDPWYSGRYGLGWGPRWRFYNRGLWSPWSRWGGYGWRDDFDVREITRYEAIAEVVMHRGPRPDRVDAFDAREVIANLGPRVQRPMP